MSHPDPTKDYEDDMQLEKETADQDSFHKQIIAENEKTLKYIKYQNETLNFLQQEINKALGL